MKYIIEICVAIDLAILSIAYPIIINEINKIGEKYKSNYLLEIFKTEVPQRQIEFPEWITNILPTDFLNISRFKFYLIITIISFLFLIINRPPLFGMDFWLINNSAKLLVFFLTIVLVYNFLIWLDKVALYNGKTIDILQYVIKRFKASQTDSDIYKYSLKTINEFTYYSIRNQDAHIQVELLDFYYEQFDLERQDWLNSIEILDTDSDNIVEQKNKIKKEGVKYSSELYDLVYTVNLELSRTNNVYIKGIEHQAVSGWWLLGKGYEQMTISQQTYDVIWSILKLSIDRDKVLKQYWAKAHQYFQMGLDYIIPEYIGDSMEVSNKEEIGFRENERAKYLEFHFALGGLLLYQEKYNTIKYILSYSQSSPPSYVLLPANMTQIFKWYEGFRNVFKYRLENIENSYSFPDLENYGVSYQMSHWICQYLILLFIRQFTLRKIYSYEDHTGKPFLPDGVIELRNWLDSVNHFEGSFQKLVQNKELLKVMNYQELIDEKEPEIENYIKELGADIKSRIKFVEVNKSLSVEKVSNFTESTERVIRLGLDNYNLVINDYDRDIIYDSTKLTLTGTRSLMTKAAFVEGEIPHFNYNSITAEGIVQNGIKRFFPTSFIFGATHKYLFNPELINEAIKTALGNGENNMIIGFNIHYKYKESIKSHFPDVIFLFSTQHRFKNALFVLDEKDLPVIIKRKPQKEVLEKYKLKPTSDGSFIYTSILDLESEDNSLVREEWLETDSEENIKQNVQIMIWMLYLILWKKDRHIIQIGIDTRDEEKGVRNEIDDIIPL